MTLLQKTYAPQIKPRIPEPIWAEQERRADGEAKTVGICISIVICGLTVLAVFFLNRG